MLLEKSLDYQEYQDLYFGLTRVGFMRHQSKKQVQTKLQVPTLRRIYSEHLLLSGTLFSAPFPPTPRFIIRGVIIFPEYTPLFFTHSGHYHRTVVHGNSGKILYKNIQTFIYFLWGPFTSDFSWPSSDLLFEGTLPAISFFLVLDLPHVTWWKKFIDSCDDIFTCLFISSNPSEDDRGKFWKLSWKDLKIFLSVETFQVVTKPEQKLLPKYLLFLGTWRITSSPQMPKVWSKPKKLSHKAKTLNGETIGGWYCQVPCHCSKSCWRSSQRCSPNFPLSALSFPKHACKEQENCSLYHFFKSLKEVQLLQIKEQFFLYLCPTWIRLQLIPGATSDRVQICLHRDRLNESKQCNWFQTCS